MGVLSGSGGIRGGASGAGGGSGSGGSSRGGGSGTGGGKDICSLLRLTSAHHSNARLGLSSAIDVFAERRLLRGEGDALRCAASIRENASGLKLRSASSSRIPGGIELLSRGTLLGEDELPRLRDVAKLERDVARLRGVATLRGVGNPRLLLPN